jgi:membrane-associated protease RseP (regulator of RpoE activity)
VLILSLVVYGALAMVVHELGHLTVARRCKVPASELGLGVGPRVFGFRLGGIRFSFRALPLASFVRLDGTALEERPVQQRLFVHLGGVLFNTIAGLVTYGTLFSWMNLLLSAGNLLPFYQHDGWKCGVAILRTLLQRKSQPAEWAFTFSGGFVSLIIVYTIIRVFI